MGIKAKDLREYIVRPTLEKMNMWSKSAENLLMGTAAQESKLGYYLKQLRNGPAIGLYQMEPRTFDCVCKNVWERACNKSSFLKDYPIRSDPNEMLYDLQFATIMCRLQYWRFNEVLPHHEDEWGLAAYWKKYYNTTEGKGRPNEFVHNYQTAKETQ